MTDVEAFEKLDKLNEAMNALRFEFAQDGRETLGLDAAIDELEHQFMTLVDLP